MDSEVFVEPSNEQLQRLAAEAFYSGDRILLKGEDGRLAAIVPLEDLEIIQEIEGVEYDKRTKYNRASI